MHIGVQKKGNEGYEAKELNGDQYASDGALKAIFEKDIRYERDASPPEEARVRTSPRADDPGFALKRRYIENGMKPNGLHDKQIG